MRFLHSQKIIFRLPRLVIFPSRLYFIGIYGTIGKRGGVIGKNAKSLYRLQYTGGADVMKMDILTKLEKEKGVSPVIAVVLMIAVAVAIAVIVYAWASGFTTEKTGAEAAITEQLIVESQKLSGGALDLYIRNTTSTAAILDTVYINGELIASSLGVELVADGVTEVDLQALTGVTIDADNDVENILLVTKEGTQINLWP